MRSSHLPLVAAIGALALPASAFGIAQIHKHSDGLRSSSGPIAVPP